MIWALRRLLKKTASICLNTADQKTVSGAAADAFFTSFLGAKKEVGNGGKAPNTPTRKSKKAKQKTTGFQTFSTV